MPKVSIILPTYNGEKYLRYSIESVISQTFSDYELIIVNDYSTDSTSDIVEEFLKKDNRIKLINNSKNERLSESLNIGFKEAKGEYVTWTSDDNIYLPNAILTMVNFLDNNKDAYMVCADMKYINNFGNIIGDARPFSDNIYFRNDVGACFLYRKEVINKIGQYDKSMELVEDYDYWIRIYNCFGKIYHINKILYHYRVHEGSLSTTKSEMVRKQLYYLRDKYKLWDKIEPYLGMDLDFYYDYLFNRKLKKSTLNKYWNIYPELKCEFDASRDLNINEEVLLFGAGEIGKTATGKLKDKVIAFIDNNASKSKVLCEKQVLSFVDARKFIKGNDIIICANSINTQSIMKQLYAEEIYNFISWRLYEKMLNKP